MDKIILIKRYQPSSFCWKNLLRKNTIPGESVEAILDKYKGFGGGELIEIYYVKNNDLEINEMIDLFYESQSINHYLMLYVRSIGFNNPISFQGKKVGFDVGRCDEESVFSSITSEIIFGIVKELVEFKNTLNEYFLFPTQEIAEKYVEVHNKMSAAGKDVEDYIPLEIYEIWQMDSHYL